MSAISLRTRIILIISVALLAAGVAVYLIAESRISQLTHRYQTELYIERLATIFAELEFDERRLQQTGLREAYLYDFKNSALVALESTYKGQAAHPLILDDRGVELLWGSDSDLTPEIIQRALDQRGGPFEFDANGSAGVWVVGRRFEPWGWTLLYVVSPEERYAQARALSGTLGIVLVLVLAASTVLASLSVSRALRPIGQLSAASRAMADGDLEYPLPPKTPGEIGVLARSFARMRDAIRSQLRSLELEIQERKQAQRRQRLMMSELDHRVKNNLAAVQGLAEQTLVGAESIKEFSASFLGRLQAMARTHEALAEARWEGIDLHSAANLAVMPFCHANAERVSIEGEEVRLPARAALPLSLTLHELATNALKYGSLSVPDGRVSLTWQRDGEDRVDLVWQESDGPPVNSPANAGTGTQLIRGLVSYELQGELDLDYALDGLRCRITFLPSRLTSRAVDLVLATDELS